MKEGLFLLQGVIGTSKLYVFGREEKRNTEINKGDDEVLYLGCSSPGAMGDIDGRLAG